MRCVAFFLYAFVAFLAPTQATNLTVEIYTIPECLWCQKAKSWLKEQGIPYTDINIARRPDLYAQMKQRAGGNPEDSMTVPRIFINGQHIGGYFDLRNFDFEAPHSKQQMASGG